MDTSFASILLTKFSSNDAGSKGGVISAINSSIDLVSSHFYSNGKDVSNGGVISISFSATLYSFNNTFFGSKVRYNKLIF
jgi:hypothetical protein